MALSEEFEQECCASLAQVGPQYFCTFNIFKLDFLNSQAIERHVREAAVARSQGKEEWWKVFSLPNNLCKVVSILLFCKLPITF